MSPDILRMWYIVKSHTESERSVDFIMDYATKAFQNKKFMLDKPACAVTNDRNRKLLVFRMVAYGALRASLNEEGQFCLNVALNYESLQSLMLQNVLFKFAKKK